MSRLRTLVPLALVAPMLSGCLVVHQSVFPGLETVVIDAATRRPISDAEAVVAHAPSRPPGRAAYRSDASGRLAIPPITRTLYLPPVPGDVFPLPGEAMISAPGYAAVRVTIGRAKDDRAGLIGPRPPFIALQPAPQPLQTGH